MLNVGLFGTPGIGKSSLLNSLKFALKLELTELTREQTSTDNFEGGKTVRRLPAQITRHLVLIDNRGVGAEDLETIDAGLEIIKQLELLKFQPPEEWKAVILLHSATLGRLSLTDVSDARYDALLQNLEHAYGKEAICVIAYDVTNFDLHSRDVQLAILKSTQKSVFELSSGNVIICHKLNNLHHEDSLKLQDFFEKVYQNNKSLDENIWDNTENGVGEHELTELGRGNIQDNKGRPSELGHDVRDVNSEQIFHANEELEGYMCLLPTSCACPAFVQRCFKPCRGSNGTVSSGREKCLDSQWQTTVEMKPLSHQPPACSPPNNTQTLSLR